MKPAPARGYRPDTTRFGASSGAQRRLGPSGVRLDGPAPEVPPDAVHDQPVDAPDE